MAGELGDGPGRSSLRPVRVAGGLALAGPRQRRRGRPRDPDAGRGRQVVPYLRAKGGYTCALDPAGAAWCWGANSQGQLGDGTREDRTLPVRVEIPAGLVAIATGAAHACAVDDDGRVHCWGANVRGQLGDGTTETRVAPVPVEGAAGFVAVAAGTSLTGEG